MSGGGAFRKTFPRAHGAGERVLPRFCQDRTTTSSAPPRLTSLVSVISSISVAWIFKFTVLFALVLIGLFVVVPKTDAKPHLFITLSQLLCAANPFQGSCHLLTKCDSYDSFLQQSAMCVRSPPCRVAVCGCFCRFLRVAVQRRANRCGTGTTGQHNGDEQRNGGPGQHIAPHHGASQRAGYRGGHATGKRGRIAPHGPM